jgi:hypothetical protein
VSRPVPTMPAPGVPEKRPPTIRFEPDGYGMLLEPRNRREDHHCEPPGQRNCLSIQGMPEVIGVTVDVDDGLWRCQCGQAWHGRDSFWWPVTDRTARKMLKRRGGQPA